MTCSCFLAVQQQPAWCWLPAACKPAALCVKAGQQEPPLHRLSKVPAPVSLCDSTHCALFLVLCTAELFHMDMAFECSHRSTDFGPTFSVCLQMECASKLEVSCALCAQLCLLGFLQSSSQAELGAVLFGMQVTSCSARLLTCVVHVSSCPSSGQHSSNLTAQLSPVLQDASQIAQ